MHGRSDCLFLKWRAIEQDTKSKRSKIDSVLVSQFRVARLQVNFRTPCQSWMMLSHASKLTCIILASIPEQDNECRGGRLRGCPACLGMYMCTRPARSSPQFGTRSYLCEEGNVAWQSKSRMCHMSVRRNLATHRQRR